jgi:hypothetical protein
MPVKEEEDTRMWTIHDRWKTFKYTIYVYIKYKRD